MGWLQEYLDVTMLCLAKAEQEGRKVIMTGPRRRLLPGLDHKHRADQLTQLCLQPMELVGIGKCSLLQVSMACSAWPFDHEFALIPAAHAACWYWQVQLAAGEHGVLCMVIFS